MSFSRNVDNLSRADLLLILQFSNISAPEAADCAARLATLVHLLTDEQWAVFLRVLGRAAPSHKLLVLEDQANMTGSFRSSVLENMPSPPIYSGTFLLHSVGRIEADKVTETQVLSIVVSVVQELILKGEIFGVQADSVTPNARILSDLHLDLPEAAGYCGRIVDAVSNRVVATCMNFGEMEDISLDCCSKDTTLGEYAQRLHAELSVATCATDDSRQTEADC